MSATPHHPPEPSEALAPCLATLQRWALGVGLLGAAAAAAGWAIDPSQFHRSYLVAFLFWVGLPLGSMAILMVHHLAGGTWGYAIRRLLEAATRTLPLMLLLVLPLLAGIPVLYEWSHPEVVAADPLLQAKSAYLNPPFFVARTLFYFAVWGTLSWLLNRWSTQQDGTAETYPTRRLQVLSGPGIVAYALTATFAAIDWVMSLEPHWYSTIYGLLFIVGQALSTWAFVIAVAVPLSRRPPLARVLTAGRLRDLGTFTLACVMLWAYLSFSQLLIIWSANLPEEITWYLRRLEGPWLLVGILLVAFHFAVPLLLLISRRLKGRTRLLTGVAVGLLVMRLVDLYWITAPAFSGHGYHAGPLHLHWLDLALPVGIGGLWLAFFLWQLGRRPLLALNDPRFTAELLGEEAHHG